MTTELTIFKRVALLLALPVILLSCVKEETAVSTLTRSTDKISLSYGNSTATFTVRNVGPWSVWSEADWLSFDPAKGDGDGNTYTTVTVTAQANPGDARSAVIYLKSSDKTLEITATQEAGLFELGAVGIAYLQTVPDFS